ncbi:MAG: hypothetical protein WCP15_03405 [bacterium]
MNNKIGMPIKEETQNKKELIKDETLRVPFSRGQQNNDIIL